MWVLNSHAFTLPNIYHNMSIHVKIQNNRGVIPLNSVALSKNTVTTWDFFLTQSMVTYCWLACWSSFEVLCQFQWVPWKLCSQNSFTNSLSSSVQSVWWINMFRGFICTLWSKQAPLHAASSPEHLYCSAVPGSIRSTLSRNPEILIKHFFLTTRNVHMNSVYI